MSANAVIYARYSSDKQNEQSIDGQIRFCQQYAELNGYNIIGSYIDRAISGTTDERPEFQRMIQDSSRKQFKFIIVWKLDRFSRNRYDSAIYKNKLRKNGVKVLSATEGIGEGDESIILEAVLEAMAETYSRQLAQNVRRGLKESAMKCASTGGTIPYGFRLENGKLAIDEETAPIVKYVFEQYANGVGKAALAKELNGKGIRTRQGTEFNPNTFKRMFNNKKYIGVYCYDGLEIEGGCPAIVSKELFEKCRRRAELNRRAPAKAKAKEEYLLQGKLFCGHCGTQMVGDCGTGRHGNRYYYYACNNVKKKLAPCDKKREKKDYIEWYVCEQTVEYVLTEERIQHISKRVAEVYNNGLGEDEIKRLERKLLKLENDYNKIANSLINATSQRMIDTINAKAEAIEVEIQETENTLVDLRISSKARLNVDDIEKWLRGFCTGDLMDLNFRKRIIDVLVNAVYLYDDKLVIYFNVKDGKQVSYIEMLDDIESFIEGECSNLGTSGSPESTSSEVLFCFVA
ncbi:MAG: recombinase family protein [Clostridia bacterium]|nr:recombinase family protein [Clostridia bacterium]